ncbi:hypothetical protein P7K49_020558 [Saguinus oedipus]|uniref:Uncharacterized protein n=1 Tax=Saguinus oedipus TaxID=9490 RepID=A0ABQ9V1A8_SAGOE|nr:hypothetical protein P7K49_020558 [Saguinus oedipus]
MKEEIEEEKEMGEEEEEIKEEIEEEEEDAPEDTVSQPGLATGPDRPPSPYTPLLLDSPSAQPPSPTA